MSIFDRAWSVAKNDDLGQQPIEVLLDKVRRNIPGYHDLTDEQLIEVIRWEGIEGLTTDEMDQMRDARRDNGGENDPQTIANVEALIALRQRVMEM